MKTNIVNIYAVYAVHYKR